MEVKVYTTYPLTKPHFISPRSFHDGADSQQLMKSFGSFFNFLSNKDYFIVFAPNMKIA